MDEEAPRLTPLLEVFEGEKDWEETLTSMVQGMRRRPSKSTDSARRDHQRK
jgi:hypothetical protein